MIISISLNSGINVIALNFICQYSVKLCIFQNANYVWANKKTPQFQNFSHFISHLIKFAGGDPISLSTLFNMFFKMSVTKQLCFSCKSWEYTPRQADWFSSNFFIHFESSWLLIFTFFILMVVICIQLLNSERRNGYYTRKISGISAESKLLLNCITFYRIQSIERLKLNKTPERYVRSIWWRCNWAALKIAKIRDSSFYWESPSVVDPRGRSNLQISSRLLCFMCIHIEEKND